jgi:PEP-CTERM motif
MQALWRMAVAVGVLMGTVGIVRADIVNQAPVANPGGPYFIHLGDDLRLDGSGSTDPDFPSDSLVSYLWDLDRDGAFDDVSGATPTVVWSSLFAMLHPQLGKSYAIALKVEDSAGAWSIPGETTLSFLPSQPDGGTVPEPSSVALLLLGGVMLAGAALRSRFKRLSAAGSDGRAAAG